MVDYTDWDQYIASMNKGRGCWYPGLLDYVIPFSRQKTSLVSGLL